MVILKIKTWYGKYERPVSSLFLLGGFVVDILTIQAVSLYWQNVWIIANLVIVGTCIILVHWLEKNEGDEANPSKAHFWLVNILQFFFGGMLSTFLVSYFRSADISVSWPFLLILALAFWANESFKRHYVRLVFQISLYFLSIFTFAIFFVPILSHKIGAWMFIVSGLVSLLVIALFIFLLKSAAKEEFFRSRNILILSILCIFAVMNVLYFTNLIPPFPLSLKDAGVYHSLRRNTQGNYEVGAEPKGRLSFLSLYPDIHKQKGQPLYVYSAIFSPQAFKMQIFHEWQKKDDKTGEWVTQNKTSLSVVGGRKGGFRTYSIKSNPEPGRWKVNVLTDRGQHIGSIRFDVILVDSKPNIVNEVKD